MKAYKIDNNRFFVSVREATENPRKKGSFMLAPGEITGCDDLAQCNEFQIPRLKPDNKIWELLPDYRGVKLYDKSNGEEKENIVAEPGVTPPEDYTLVEPDRSIGMFIKFEDNRWVVDEEKQAAYEEKQAEQDKINQINELKQKLQDTDYVVIKIAEGEAQRGDYEDILTQRKAWRAKINELENNQ